MMHKTLAERWPGFSLMEQMGHIGSEVRRVLYFKEIKNRQELEQATYRTLELIDATLSLQKSPGALKELARLRELVAAIFLGQEECELSDLSGYFLPFALAARKDT